MPRTKTGKPRGRPRKSALVRGIGIGRRRAMYNPQPVFTETVLANLSGHDYICLANDGAILTVSMDQIPQLAQYSSLYQKYKILKATFICLPKFTNQEDQNAAQYNNSNSTYGYGASRVVYAINDSPAQAKPTSELQVLQDNGCRIQMLSEKGVRVTCRPTPDTKDANGVQLTQRGKFINFATPNVPHFGVSMWMSQPFTATGSAAVLNSLYGYIKITFQLSDPK